MNFELRRIRDFGDVLSDTFLFVKLNFKPLIRAWAYICGIFIIAGVVAEVMFRLNMRHGGFVQPGERPDFRNFSLTVLGYLFTVYFEYFMVALTTMSYVSAYLEKGSQPPTVEEVWLFVKYYFFRYLGGAILFVIVQFLGFMLCFIPGIYVLPAIALAPAILVIENAGIFYSLQRAFELIRNRWWYAFGAMMIMGLVAYAIVFAGSIPAVIDQLFLTTFGSHDVQVVLQTIVSIITHLFHAAFMLPYICTCILYFSLQEEKESIGLSRRIQHFGTAGNEAPPTDEEY